MKEFALIGEALSALVAQRQKGAGPCHGKLVEGTDPPVYRACVTAEKHEAVLKRAVAAEAEVERRLNVAVIQGDEIESLKKKLAAADEQVFANNRAWQSRVDEMSQELGKLRDVVGRAEYAKNERDRIIRDLGLKLRNAQSCCQAHQSDLDEERRMIAGKIGAVFSGSESVAEWIKRRFGQPCGSL